MRRGAFALLLLCAVHAAVAQESEELGRIPPEAPSTPPAAERGSLRRVVYLESATEPNLLRSELEVPYPPPAPPEIEERLLVDAFLRWDAARDLSLTLSGLAELRAASDIPFPTHENARMDVREAFATWQPFQGAYLDVGRVNLKSGVAIGYNPTDFFKARAVVEPLSADPAVLREVRLGAVMVRAQYVWRWGSVSAAFAPQLTPPSPILLDPALPSVDPMLGRTNGANRFLLKANADLVAEFSPEVVLYGEGRSFSLGANLAESIGKNIVAYGEWAGGRQASLAEKAISFGVLTATLPDAVLPALEENPALSFQQDASVGLSYATESRITFWLEYHFHQAGFSRHDWQGWFDTGLSPSGASLSAALWYIRAYALDQGVPMSKSSVFLRADWVDAFVYRLELSGFANLDLSDGSTLVQASASYAVTDNWALGALVSADIGNGRSDFGSLPQLVSGVLTVKAYF